MRIEAIEKAKHNLRKEIKEKRLENEQLDAKARRLKMQVDDRNSINKLRSNDNQEEKKNSCEEIAQ